MTSQPQIAIFVEPSFGENAHVVWLADGGPCWVVDPGLPPSAAQVLRLVEEHQLAVQAIVLTHAHADHIAGIPEILEDHPELPVLLADEESAFLTDPTKNLSAAFGASITADVAVRRDLPPGHMLTLDGTTWKALDSSGHSPGGRSLYCQDAGILIAGDALFAGSIGRTDFPHSDHDRLIRNIREQLLVLPDDTLVYPGHGPATTIGVERRTNPFVGIDAEGQRFW